MRVRIDSRSVAGAVVRNAAAYAIAAAIIWYEVRGFDLHELLRAIASANLVWLVPATLVSFGVWFLGENLLFSRLFSYFHEQTGYKELLPATATAYFLQLVNTLASGGALVLFLHRRKGASWTGAAFTMLFVSFIDGFVLSTLTIISCLLFPGSPMRNFMPYAAGALIFLLAVAAWWLWRRPKNRYELWLRERPSLVSFRLANPRIYFTLALIRLGIFIPQAFTYYFGMKAFHLRVPLSLVCAVTPAIVAAGGTPLTPVGIGPLQAVAIEVFRGHASEARVLAAYLVMGAALMIYRLPLGVSAAGAYSRAVLDEPRPDAISAR
jgi:uncharacterized membrane protein YbhN (UPF0104 family)